MSKRKIKEPLVPILLRGGQVTSTFRDALFDAAKREGMSANEFVLQAAAEKLTASGRRFSGIFNPGDLDTARGA
ncbi:hypothetical protein [Rhizobium leguminosarum]